MKHPITEEQIAASRFLAQATMGVRYSDIEDLTSWRGNTLEKRLRNWVTDQFEVKPPPPLFKAMLEREHHHKRAWGGRHTLDPLLWEQLIKQGGLRMRVTFALSEIFVINWATGGPGMGLGFSGAAYWDLLVDHAFGNYRTLLEAICRSPEMGRYLTYLNNRKADEQTGALPDENFAREILQLFSIGLHELNQDGTPKLRNGKPIETYGLDDIMGLSRVFTGWVLNENHERRVQPRPEEGIIGVPTPFRRQMAQRPEWHETGEKKFLGKTIPAGTNGVESLTQALDHIFNHPNVPPFISKQLIQRLVKSNPSRPYVSRVAGTFINNGKGVRGDLKAVIMAILMDTEARTPRGGKLREPVLRFTQWARAFDAAPPGAGQWQLGDLSDPARELGQSPLRSPSVFNFFRPGYIAPNTASGKDGMLAPEFQITDEVSVAGYINYMQRAVENHRSMRIEASYDDYLPLAEKPVELIDQLSLVLAAYQVGDGIKKRMAKALNSIDARTTTGKEKRVKAAVLLILTCPHFVVIT